MTVPDWLPGAERHPGQGSGPMMIDASWKLLLHTTEGPTLDGALQALDAKRAWSHLVADLDTGQVVQCVPFSQAARALKSGGTVGRTNAAKVIQIEVVGFAHESPSWSPERNAALGSLIRRVAAVVPFRPAFDLPFYGDDAGFTVASTTARQRLPWDAWYRYDAVCGHQHAPANDHWDPGGINVAQILPAGPHPAPTPIPEDEMSPTDSANLAKVAAFADKYGPILDQLQTDYLTKGKGVRQVIVHDEALDEEEAIALRNTPKP